MKVVIDNILGKFHPIVAFIVANKSTAFNHPMLREVATSSLSRLGSEYKFFSIFFALAPIS
jgi:hypothetical protein